MVALAEESGHTLGMDVAKSSFDWGSELPELTGERLTLCSLEPSDAPAIFEVFSDPRVAEHWSSPAMKSLAEAHELLEEIDQLFDVRALFQWGVSLNATETIIGTCTLYQLDTSNRRAEIGFALGSAHWGQGLATEAVSRLLDFAFGELNLHRLEADVDPDNTASLYLLEKLGFQREGLLRERWRLNGGVQDTVLLGLLRHERLGGRAQ